MFFLYVKITQWISTGCSNQYTKSSPFSTLVDTSKSQFVSETKSWFGAPCVNLRLCIQLIHTPALIYFYLCLNYSWKKDRKDIFLFTSAASLHLPSELYNTTQISIVSLIMDIKLWKLKQQTIFSLGKCCNFLVITKKRKWSLHVLTASRKTSLCSQPAEQLRRTLLLIRFHWSQERVSDGLPVFKNTVTWGKIRNLSA